MSLWLAAFILPLFNKAAFQLICVHPILRHLCKVELDMFDVDGLNLERFELDGVISMAVP